MPRSHSSSASISHMAASPRNGVSPHLSHPPQDDHRRLGAFRRNDHQLICATSWNDHLVNLADASAAQQAVSTMMSKYQQSYRRMLVDMHIPDWDPAFLSRYDPAALAQHFTQANLTAAMLYCKSHAGLCYWPTKVGKMHTGIGGRDVVGAMLTELRSRDIAACAYYSIVFDNWAVETH